MKRLDLSICIPTYNRSRNVVALAADILASNEPGIEIVVLDNGSTDDTVEKLHQLADTRLAIYSNAANFGVLHNILNVLDKAKGRYAVLLLDKDRIDLTEISRFRSFLTTSPAPAFGYCEYGIQSDVDAIRCAKGFKALRRLGYLGHHPTGYFFDTALLRSINFLERFSVFSFVGHFPLDFIFAELSLIGDGAVYQRPLFTPESAEGAAQYKSIGTTASTTDAFFSPSARLQTAINFSHHAEMLPISLSQRNQLVAERFLQGLLAATLGYRSVMSNAQLCTHYHISKRVVGLSEMLSVAIRFHKVFFAAISSGSCRPRLLRIAAVHLLIVVAVIRSVVRKRIGARQ